MFRKTIERGKHGAEGRRKKQKREGSAFFIIVTMG
jgi:hypothetical protein